MTLSKPPPKGEVTQVKLLILTWPTGPGAGKYLKTNYEVAKRLSTPRSPPGQKLASAPRGLTRTQSLDHTALEVSIEVFFVPQSYPALTDFVKSKTAQKYDAVLILGLEDDRATEKAIPDVVLEQISRRKGFKIDSYGMNGELAEADGTHGVPGDKDHYESRVKAEWLKAALIGRGFQNVAVRDLATDEIADGGPQKPFLCEYLYTQLLRDAEEQGSHPLVFLTHLTYVKDEPEPGHEGGPYTLDENVELIKCVAWFMAKQVAKEKLAA